MFKKIVSRISFSPALVAQLGFYAKRLRKEQATRRLGLIFVALALVVQSLVVFQAPEPANASNPSDMVQGGLGYGSNLSIGHFLRPYDQNVKNLRDTMNYFGITRAEIAATKFGSYRMGDTYAWGFEPRPGSRAVAIKNSAGAHVTTLHGRQPAPYYNANNQVDAFIGHSAKFGWFAIMRDCGNLVTPKWPPEPLPAKVETSKSAVNLSQGAIDATKKPAKANDNIRYTIAATNSGDYSTKVTMVDNLSEVLKYASLVDNGGGTLNPTTGTLSWPEVTLGAKATIRKTYAIKMNSSLVSRTACTMTNTFVNSSVKVPVDCTPPPANITASKSAINVTQNKINATKTPAREKDVITYTVSVKNTGGTAKAVTMKDDLSEVLNYATVSDLGGGTVDTATNMLTWPTVNVGADQTVTKKYSIKMNDSLISKVDTCKMTNNFLDKKVTVTVGCSTLPPEFVPEKSATNVTQANIDATTKIAKTKDRITYTLRVKNMGGKPGEFTFEDNIRDTLEYADLIDNGGGTLNDETKTLSWPKVTIASGGEEVRTFTVQVRESIPATPTGLSDSHSYNCRLDNSFNGATTVIQLDCPGAKVIEQVKELPQTGAGTNIAFGAITLAVATFFYFRSRQLGTEVRLVRRNVSEGVF